MCFTSLVREGGVAASMAVTHHEYPAPKQLPTLSLPIHNSCVPSFDCLEDCNLRFVLSTTLIVTSALGASKLESGVLGFAMPAYREIEVNLFSAEDLRDVRIFGGKMSPYVVAWVHHDMKAYSPVDVKGSTNPTWNAKLLVYGDEAALEHPDEAVVYFELHDANSTSNRLIGYLAFPLTDLPANITSLKEPSEPVFLNLPVKRPSGREQGVLNFTLKLGGMTHEPVLSDPRHHEEEANFNDGGAPGMADEESPSSFAPGCCVLPHFYRDDHNFHRQDGTNVFAH